MRKKVNQTLPGKRFLLKERVLRTSDDLLPLLQSLIASFSDSIEEPTPENLHGFKLKDVHDVNLIPVKGLYS